MLWGEEGLRGKEREEEAEVNWGTRLCAGEEGNVAL